MILRVSSTIVTVILITRFFSKPCVPPKICRKALRLFFKILQITDFINDLKPHILKQFEQFWNGLETYKLIEYVLADKTIITEVNRCDVNNAKNTPLVLTAQDATFQIVTDFLNHLPKNNNTILFVKFSYFFSGKDCENIL